MTFFAQNSKRAGGLRSTSPIRHGSADSQPPSWRHLASTSIALPSLSAIDWPAITATPRQPIPAIDADALPPVALRSKLPATLIPNGHRHQQFWGWLHALVPGIKPAAFVAIWPRGGAKSTSAEMATVWAALTLRRRFVLYVSGTQVQADMHLQTIAAILERAGEERAINAYGSSKGWAAQILRTARGFNAISIGLDGNVRGAKLDELRPDLIILDDVDSRHDSPLTITKKIRTITQTILPAGSADAAVVFVQNLVHEDSCIAQIADGRADALLARTISREPAIEGLEMCREPQSDGTVRYRISAGTPTWPEGQGLAVCEGQINEWGPSAFWSESQHAGRRGGGMWDQEADIDPFRVTAAPELVAVAVAIDPPGGATEAGIVGVGRDVRGHIYVLADSSLRGAPEVWAAQGVSLYHTLQANILAAEVNFGGDMVERVMATTPDAPAVLLLRASRGKIIRAEPVKKLYGEGKVHHVGTFPGLERELTTWQMGMPSPNRLDALVWAVTAVLEGAGLQRVMDVYRRRAEERKKVAA